MRKAIALLALAVVAAGCSKEKDVEQPAELVDFVESLSVSRAWDLDMGGDEVLRLALSPAVDGETAYLAGQDGDVAAVGVADGRSRWRTRLKLDLSAGPGVGAGLVVVGSPEGQVVALDAEGGAERWRVRVNGEVLARPAVGRSIVVVHTVDGRIHGLRTEDGTLAWTYEQQSPRLSLRGLAAPVIDGDSVICAFDNGKVAALDLQDGDLLWAATVSPARGRTELSRLVDIDSSVQVAGDDIFVVGFQGRAAMLARDTGQIWWARDLSSHRGLALDDQLVFVSTAESAVVAMSRRDGTEVWRQDAMRLRGLTSPAVDGDAIVVGDYDGYLHWLDRGTGALLGRARGGGERISNAPVSAAGLVLVQDDGGDVTAFRTKPRG